MGVSSICVVHCLALPVLLATLPLWPMAVPLHGWLHVVFAVVLVPTTLLAARAGYQKHRSKGVLIFLSAGLAIVVLASILGHEAPGALTETALTLLGSGLLITGHWRNRRLAGVCEAPLHDGC